MPETIETLVREAIASAQAAGELAAFEVADVGLERPADTGHGDWTSTVAMRSAKLAHAAPRAIAQAIVDHLPQSTAVDHVEVAGPGFINFYLAAAANNEVFRTVIDEGADFGRTSAGAGEKVQVEFISANPVGPMHVGHGRWAALGDSLCNVLDFAGYDVEREYYINDHGSQMDVFGNSIAMRYLQIGEIADEKGVDVAAAAQVLLDDRARYVEDEEDEHPESHPHMDAFNERLGGNAYGGDYIIDLARQFWETDGDAYVGATDDERLEHFREDGYQLMLASIRETCHEARCDFDVWFSERTLYVPDDEGKDAVHRAFDRLEEQGYLYTTDDGALWFRSTALGDDKDRVLVKTNGEYTYFASDIAYHWNKFQRVDYVIDIWGADHHGYIKRVDNAISALGYPGKFEVLLGQLVNLLRNGKPVRMSKRKGTMVTFDELIDEVGPDAMRYTLVSKSSNQMIDFDIEAVKRASADNPVYYVQYAHARICSILRRAAGVTDAEADELGMDEVAARAIGGEYDLSLLTDAAELALSRKVSEFPELVAGCARDRAPFRITHYVEELAADFHSFYRVCQVLPSEARPMDEDLSRARLVACDAVRRTIAQALRLIGVSAPTRM